MKKLAAETPSPICAEELLLSWTADIIRNEHGTLTGDDPEALHDMRVASRRLREALRIFAFCFAPAEYDKLDKQARRITRTLRETRDHDVLIQYLEKIYQKRKDRYLRLACADMLRTLLEKRQKAQRRLQSKLRRLEVSALPANIIRALQAHSPVTDHDSPTDTAGALAQSLIVERLRTVFETKAQITGENDNSNLHRLRIEVKHLRYAIETLDFAVGPARTVRANLRQLRKLQTTLGDLHDRDVFLEVAQNQQTQLGLPLPSELMERAYLRLSQFIATERSVLYRRYAAQFAEAEYADWQRRLLPGSVIEQPPPPAPETVVPPAPETAPGKDATVTDATP